MRYGYQYDRLNRLLKGVYQDPDRTSPMTGINDESILYDLNGNITNLYRNTKHNLTYTAMMIDNLVYTYTGNRVTSISDATNNRSGYEGGGGTIGYDANGNMTSMPDKGISNISYNYLNLPTEIYQNDNVLEYHYRADGVKLKKIFTLNNEEGTSIINTEYLDGFQYSTPNTEPIRRAIEVRDDTTVSAATAGEEEAFLPSDRLVADPGGPVIDDMILSFFPTAEGYYDYENFRYIYQYRDHLGNVRVSYVKDGNNLKIMDTNDYYPFGMSFLKPTVRTVYDPMAIPYNYKYNGKELQETGMYDYGARMYMADTGRWFNVDPLAETSRRWSTYAYAYNNPIRFIDPDGMQNYDITFGKNISADTQNKIVSDLQKETGLTLSVGSDGKLSYTETENMGGSETARNMVKGAIDNHRADYQINSDNTRGSSIEEIQGRGEKIDGVAGYTRVYDLNINTNQIDGFISGTSEALNPLTMGYGMVTLHEISHKYNNLIDGFVGSDGTEYQASTIYGLTGDNVNKMNSIRTELDASGNFVLPFGQRKSYSPLDNFMPFSSEAKTAGPTKVNLKKDLFIKTPQKK